MSVELTNKSATELLALIRARAVSPVEVAEAHLRLIDRVNPSVNAIVTIAPDVIEQARAAEKASMSGEEVGSLHGLPITVKDTIDTAGLRTTSGSRLRENDVPAKDASAVARLKKAGAIILGKTNTPEMAIPYETDNPIFGRTVNPHDPLRTAGGSSGGEAAAIAAHLSPAGIGSDLSGSIRVPAHFCGIAGLKPTIGVIAMDGHVPPAISTLALGASIGPMARNVEDLGLLFSVMADQETARPQLPVEETAVAFYTDDKTAPVTRETKLAVQAAAHALANAGYEVREERPPAVSEGSRLWIELFSNPAAEQLREFYRGQEELAGPLVRSILANREHPSFKQKIKNAERVAKAVVERERLREQLLQWMKQTPLILAPVGATLAFAHGAARVDVNGESVSVFRAFSYAQTFNVFGLPAVSVPASHSAAGLPIGVQIVGLPFAEQTVLAAALVIEEMNE